MSTSTFTNVFPGLDPRELPDNPDPRAPCVILLDVSGSMSGAPIDELNRGLQVYQSVIQADKLASRRAEIALVTFGGTIQVVQPFVEARYFQAPTLSTSGDTPMASAVLEGIRLITERKAELKQKGITYYRPWLFLFTDGGPTDGEPMWRSAREAIQTGEASAFTFFPVGVGGANMTKLGELSLKMPPVSLDGIDFTRFFLWLSKSQSVVGQSQPGQDIKLPPPDWTNIKL
jgi:uncharacterized protein YegL